MLANETLMTAAKAGRRKAMAAALRVDPRVIFACAAARVSSVASDGRGEPCVAVYVEAEGDPGRVGVELAERLAAKPGLGHVEVTVLNDLDLDEAGRMLEEAEILVDRDPERRSTYTLLATGAYLDFRESEAVFLRERAERPYADTLAIKLTQLDEAIRRLRELRGLTADAYLADWKTAYVAERALEVAIGLCIDVARHVVAERAMVRPLTYRETFAIARDAGLLEPGVAAALMGMCGFRNRLAHECTRLDATIVARMFESGVDDLARFRAAMSRL